jgi:hypothetical protein
LLPSLRIAYPFPVIAFMTGGGLQDVIAISS